MNQASIESEGHMIRTSIDPDYRYCNDHEGVVTLKQECVPQSELHLERNRVREQRDVPFGRIRGRRNHMLLERGIDSGHFLLR